MELVQAGVNIRGKDPVLLNAFLALVKSAMRDTPVGGTLGRPVPCISGTPIRNQKFSTLPAGPPFEYVH